MTQVIAPATMTAFAQWISQRMGLQDLDRRHDDLVKALQRAARDAKAPSPQALAEDLLRDSARNPKALQRIVPYLTVGETYFFRDAALHHVLETIVLPERLAAIGRPLRIWSAACSSGEEPYSVAIALKRIHAGTGHHILATDLNPQAIDVARGHTYRDWSMRGLLQAQRDHWFVKLADGRWRLRSDVATQVEFEVHNLLDPELPTGSGGLPYDVILCRNVLIYLDLPSAERVIQRLLSQLADGGWLFVAAVETFLVPSPPNEMVNLGEIIAFRKLGSADGASLPKPAEAVTYPWPWPAIPLSWPPELSSGISSELLGNALAPDAVALPIEPQYNPPNGNVSHPIRLRHRPPASRLGEQLEPAGRGAGHTDVSVLYQAGQLAESKGEWAHAGANWRKVLFLDPSHLLAQLAMARWQFHIGKRKDAARSARHAAVLAAKWPESAPIPDGNGQSLSVIREQIYDLQARLEAHD